MPHTNWSCTPLPRSGPRSVMSGFLPAQPPVPAPLAALEQAQAHYRAGTPADPSLSSAHLAREVQMLARQLEQDQPVPAPTIYRVSGWLLRYVRERVDFVDPGDPA